MSVEGQSYPTGRELDEIHYTNIEDYEKNSLRREFETMLEKVGRPDIKQTIQWDIRFNTDEISQMLRKLNTYKPHNGEVLPVDATAVLLTAAGADLEGFKLKSPETAQQEKINHIENPFKNELLKVENVWQTVRRAREKVVGEYGETITKEYLITEFRLKDVIHIDTSKVKLTQREQFLAMAAEQYLQMRYQWDTNILQDKKYLVVKELNDAEVMVADTVFSDLGINREDQYSDEGISKKDIDRKTKLNRYGHSDSERKHHITSVDEVVSSLGLDQLITHDSIVVNAHHGWCGDPKAMMGILAEAMYKANRTIQAKEYQGPYKNVVGIMSENLGIVSIPEKKQLHMQLIDKLAKRLGKVQNPNLSMGFFKHFRFQPDATHAPFDPETYGRDMEWTANHVFGLLGEKDDKMIKNIWIGWSYGGAGTEEFGGRVGKRLEQNWREQAPVIYKNLNDEYRQYLSLFEQGNTDPALVSHITELYSQLKKLYLAGFDYLPEYTAWQDVGAPDLLLLPHASAVNGTTDFLGPGKMDAYLKRFAELTYSAASGLTVNTGTKLLHGSRVTRYRPGRWLLQGVAGVYTKMALFTGTIQPEERDELNEIGRRHQLNFSSPINGQEVVDTQSTGLTNYHGKDLDCARLLRSQHIFMLHAIGTGDFLVNFKKWSDAEAKANIDMLSTVDDFGHSIVAKREHKQRMPIDLYIEANKGQLYLLREQMKKLARMKIGFKEVNGAPNDFINAEDDELAAHFIENQWERVIKNLDEGRVLQRKQIYLDAQNIFINDPQLAMRAMQVLEEHEAHLFIPRELKADDNRGALMRLDKLRQQIRGGLVGAVLQIMP